MFEIGDYVIYGDSGLCQVEQIGVPDFDTFGSGKAYYFLRSQEDGSRIYTPVDTRMPLRAPITREEALALLSAIPTLEARTPTGRDRKSIQQHYQELLRPHTCESLAVTVKSIYARHHGMPGRMSGAEESVLKKTEHQLCAELAAALKLSYDDARALVLQSLKTQTES